MIDRNRSELELIRRYQDRDDFFEAADTRGYVKWFVLWLKEGTVLRIGFGLCLLMLTVLVAKTQVLSRFAWVPNGAAWYEFGFLGVILVISFTSFSLFYSASMAYRRQIRDMEVRMARRDNATPEEVKELLRQTDKRLQRQTLLKLLFCALSIAVLFPIFGTTLIFPWGGILPFIGMLVVVVGGRAHHLVLPGQHRALFRVVVKEDDPEDVKRPGNEDGQDNHSEEASQWTPASWYPRCIYRRCCWACGFSSSNPTCRTP